MSRWKKRLLALVLLSVVPSIALVYWTWPQQIEAAAVPAHVPDLANGKLLYDAGGCISCHRGPDAAQAELPVGGRALLSIAGTFHAPNITPDEETGIGGWTDAQFLSAMVRGVSPDNRHYFPAFPYTSYRNMSTTDLLDLHAYLQSLEPVKRANTPHALPFEELARMMIGQWKMLAEAEPAVRPDPYRGEAWNRGAYLVQGPGHCGECHTPRNAAMIMDKERFLQGGAHPQGEGRVPSLRGLVERGRYKDADDLAMALQFGEAFGYEDLSSGGMGDVQENLSRLPEEDIRAIAVFLTALDR